MNKKRYLDKLEPWMIEAFRKHVDEGWSARTFPNRHKICQVAFHDWMQEVPELIAINKRYKSTLPSSRRGKH